MYFFFALSLNCELLRASTCMLTTLSITISEMNLTERSKKCQIPKCERFVFNFSSNVYAFKKKKMIILMDLVDHNFVFTILFWKGSKKTPNSNILDIGWHIQFLFFICFFKLFLPLNGLCWELQIICRHVSSVMVSEINCIEKGQQVPNSNIPNFLFIINFNSFFKEKR